MRGLDRTHVDVPCTEVLHLKHLLMSGSGKGNVAMLVVKLGGPATTRCSRLIGHPHRPTNSGKAMPGVAYITVPLGATRVILGDTGIVRVLRSVAFDRFDLFPPVKA